MRLSRMIAAPAALCASLMFGGAASAQEFARDYDQVRNERAAEGNTVALRWSMPLGGGESFEESAPRFSLRLSQTGEGGDLRSLGLVSYLWSGEQTQLQSPFMLNAAGDGGGGWLSSTRNQILLGVGAALVIWGVVEATEDDDEGPPPPT